MIPKNIFFAYDDLDCIHEKLLENVEFVKKQNPSYKVTIYSREMFIELLQKEKPDWLPYFNKLNPILGNLFADYVRYVLLYLYGGVYLDIKSRPRIPIDDIINEDSELWICWSPNKDIITSFMMVSKGSTFFKKVIDKFHSNVDMYHTLDLNINTPKINILRLFSTLMLADIAITDEFKDIILPSRKWNKYGIFSIFNTTKKVFSVEHHKYYNKPHYSKVKEHLILN